MCCVLSCACLVCFQKQPKESTFELSVCAARANVRNSEPEAIAFHCECIYQPQTEENLLCLPRDQEQARRVHSALRVRLAVWRCALCDASYSVFKCTRCLVVTKFVRFDCAALRSRLEQRCTISTCRSRSRTPLRHCREDSCKLLIEAHKQCLRAEGFDV